MSEFDFYRMLALVSQLANTVRTLRSPQTMFAESITLRLCFHEGDNVRTFEVLYAVFLPIGLPSVLLNLVRE